MMGMGGNKRDLAIMISRGSGDDNPDKKKYGSGDDYSEAKKESLYMAMDKFISSVKEGDAKRASMALEAWCDIYDPDDNMEMDNPSREY